jgi:two-component system sensor histidine kinase KdpD
MGLAVCRRLVEAQGGEIWAQNQKDGGLSVSFTLKLDTTRVPAGD